MRFLEFRVFFDSFPLSFSPLLGVLLCSGSEASASPRCLAGSPAQALRALRKTSSGAPESPSDQKMAVT